MDRMKKILAAILAVITVVAMSVTGDYGLEIESFAACCSCSDCSCPKSSRTPCNCNKGATDTTKPWVEVTPVKKENKHNHNYTSKTTRKATCSKEGIITYTCSCGSKYTKSIKKLAHTYSTSVVKATMSANGKFIYTCKVCGYVKTTPIAKIKSFYLTNSKFEFDDTVKTPGVVVKDANGKVLRAGTDYEVSYSKGRTQIEEYSVFVTFKGNYSGSYTLKFKIVLGVVKNITQDKKISGVAFDWSPVYGADGYILYFYDAFTKTYDRSGTKTVTNAIYSYVNGYMGIKIRAYKEINGKLVYSDYSKAVKFHST